MLFWGCRFCGKALPVNAGGHAPFPVLRREGGFCRAPGRSLRKGGCAMTLIEVLALLTLVGGTIYATFEITWTIFNGKKK